MNDEIKVVVAADADYAMPLAAMVRSVIDHHRDGRLTIRVLTRGMTPEVEARLIESWPTPAVTGRLSRGHTYACALRTRGGWCDCRPTPGSGRPKDGVRVEVHPIDQVTFDRLVGFNGITVTTYTRLLLAELLPADWDRVIYLDTDTIVCSDLRRLWRHPLHGAVLGAVQDDGVPYVSSPKGVQEWRELGLQPTQRFFNAGVLLIDLKRWRELDIGGRALAYAQQRADQRVVCDQEALNAIVAGQWQPLPEEWNVAALRHAQYAGLARQGVPVPPCRIRHFTTRDKPWTPGATPIDADLFFDHLDRTAWAGWRPGTRPAGTVAGTRDPVIGKAEPAHLAA